jgi:hypothetical protein
VQDAESLVADIRSKGGRADAVRADLKDREAFAHSNGLASHLRILEVFPSTRYEHDPNHDAQKKKRDISETSQLWKHHAPIIPPP